MYQQLQYRLRMLRPPALLWCGPRARWGGNGSGEGALGRDAKSSVPQKLASTCVWAYQCPAELG